jgi:hypothetical protein
MSKQTEIMRFMPVRPPRRIDPLTLQNQFIYNDQATKSDAMSDIIASFPNGLVSVLANAQLLLSKNPISNSEILFNNYFAGYDQLSTWIAQNYSTLNANALIEKIEECLLVENISEISFTANTKAKIWDVFLINKVLNINSVFTENCQIVIRLMNLIEKLQIDAEITNTGAGLRKLYQATVVLPSNLFPLPKEVFQIANTADLEPAAAATNYNADIEKAFAAKQELLQVVNNQYVKIKKTPITKDQFKALDIDRSFIDLTKSKSLYKSSPADLDVKYNEYVSKMTGTSAIPSSIFALTPALYTALSASTKQVITLLKVDPQNADMSVLIQLIDGLVLDYQKKTEITPGYLKSYQVGDSLLAPAFNNEPQGDITETVNMPMVKPLGVGDFMVVEQEVLRYEEKELAHIENILKGEKFERHHRNLSRTEDFSSFETEISEKTETDVRTSERFEIGTEIENQIQNTSTFSAGAQISASYGLVSGSAYADYSSTNSTLNSNAVSTNYAKEVVNRAVNTINKRSRQTRSFLTINEEETTNIHVIDNSLASIDHSIGMYYWIDKIYKAKLINYGRRLMYEFMIPEPAAFHIYTKLHQPDNQASLKMPINPADSEFYEVPLTSFAQLDESNFHIWAARYDVKKITSPPPNFIVIGKALDNSENEQNNTKSEMIPVPSGYVTIEGLVTGQCMSNSIVLFLGRAWIADNSSWQEDVIHMDEWLTLDPFRESVPFSLISNGQYAINVILKCQRTPEVFQQWQMDTYNAIMDAYSKMKSEYNDAIENIRDINAVMGENPARNREIEQEELKKSCIELFTAQRFENFDALAGGDATNYPKIRFNETMTESKFIKFFEQAFEWKNITYEFYPYFWGKRQNWLKIKNLRDNDPLFQKFLQAGSVRVVVPVNPEFALSVLHYQENGVIWEGIEQPILDNENFMSLISELNEINDHPQGVEIDTWEVKVPTNMVKLKAINPNNDPGLPNFE